MTGTNLWGGNGIRDRQNTHTQNEAATKVNPRGKVNQHRVHAKPSEVELMTYRLLLPTHYSLLTRYSLLTTHYSLLTAHYLYSLLTTHYSLLTTH